MWNQFAQFVLRYRLALIMIIGVITVFMYYQGKDIEMSYEFGSTVPKTDSEMITFLNFREDFGEDGNLLAIGMKDSAVYELENFRRLKYLGEELNKIRGVNEVMSIPRMVHLVKNTELTKFEAKSIFEQFPDNQHDLDSLLGIVGNQQLYTGQMINMDNGANLLLLSINKDILNSKKRFQLMDDIRMACDQFSEATDIKLHYAGLPFVRTENARMVQKEMVMFLILSVLVTGLIMLYFFRSWDAVLFPLIMIGVIVIWCAGTLGILGYKITILTGVIPPIIVVIGIPNSIYLLNKYHQEILKTGDKYKALTSVISKIGVVTFLTNFTTAVGFGVLAFTDIKILKEFGTVAGINIIATFFVSIIFIPAVFSYLPKPELKRLGHLNKKGLNKILNGIDLMVHRHRYSVLVGAAAIIVVSVIGLYKIKAVSFMVDDVPDHSEVKQDLLWLEKNFAGIMPLEIVVDTGKKKGVMKESIWKKVDKLERVLEQNPNISSPISIVEFIKMARQSYYNGNPDYYDLPKRDKNFILRYLQGQDDNSGFLNSFVTEDGRKMRISFKVADIGSHELHDLVEEVVKPQVEEIFGGSSKVTVTPTGTTLLFVKGNSFLIDNLKSSMLLAFVIISIIMAILFGRFRIILISLIPNMIPLLVTAGIMGFVGVALKPSTALVFSIAFGISVDDSIHYLAKYRQDLYEDNFFVPKAISRSIHEVGASMIYTSIVLFFGFIIFGFSEFGGTQALGLLTSMTLLIAMSTNLIILPALLMVFDNGKRSKADEHLLIDDVEFYHEHDDEEINISSIKIKKEGEE
ncbi:MULTISPECIES: efflux RND transporter permease subunit [Persicobacter]|uniref:Transporter n=1 Tax=Persicobacter diffluens TaxID=981 RepID=A0AAN5AL07_9BACT|nr:efflux RND transporter permease subunit [Persicobacter sp. CCB-QB2]GJM62367.1 transporter [Persicobacter diffluens]